MVRKIMREDKKGGRKAKRDESNKDRLNVRLLEKEQREGQEVGRKAKIKESDEGETKRASVRKEEDCKRMEKKIRREGQEGERNP